MDEDEYTFCHLAEGLCRALDHNCPPSRECGQQPARLPGEAAGAILLRLPCAPRSVPPSRRHTRETLAAWRVSTSVTETLVLVVSELVTNAVRYSWTRTPQAAAARRFFELSLYALADCIRVEVRDKERKLPVPTAVAEYAEGGRAGNRPVLHEPLGCVPHMRRRKGRLVRRQPGHHRRRVSTQRTRPRGTSSERVLISRCSCDICRIRHAGGIQPVAAHPSRGAWLKRGPFLSLRFAEVGALPKPRWAPSKGGWIPVGATHVAPTGRLPGTFSQRARTAPFPEAPSAYSTEGHIVCSSRFQ